MPVYTIPNNRTLIDQLRNGFNPLIGNRPAGGASLTPVVEPVVEVPGPSNVGIPEAVQTNIGIPEAGFTPEDPLRAQPGALANQAAQANAAEQAAQRAAADAAAQAAQNAAAGAAAAAAAGVLFGNETATATQTIGAFATGTGDIPLATGNSFTISNLTEAATANAYGPGAAQGVQGATNLYKRAPMPPLHPHIPSYMAHQDEAQANAMGASVMQFVKRASPAAIHNHIGIFLSAVLGLLVVVGAIWYINASVRKDRIPAAHQEGIVVEEYDEKIESGNGNGRRWLGLRQAKPVPYAGHIASLNSAGSAEEGGLRAAMGGNWNSAQKNSWETQRTGPPAYAGNGGLTDEKNSHAEFEQGNSRFV